MTCGSYLYVALQIYIPKIPGVSSAYEYTPLDFHLEYEVHPPLPIHVHFHAPIV